MKAQLEKVNDKYFSPLVHRYGFVLVNEEAYAIGALINYSAENVLVRIANDRGIVSSEISPLKSSERRFDFALYKEYLEPSKAGVLSSSLQQPEDFLDSHWEWLNDVLSTAQAGSTLAGIDDAARRRSEKLPGSNVSRDLPLMAS